MNKQLWQIGWHGGQTDGDVTDATVRRLLNLEIDIPGRLYPRHKIEHHSDNQNFGDDVLDVKYMADDPSGQGAALLMSLYNEQGNTYLFIDYIGSATSSESVLILSGQECGTGSAIVVYGDKIYLSLVDQDGDPIGIYAVYYKSFGYKFSGSYTVVSGAYTNGEISVSAGWKVESFSVTPPSLIARSTTTFTSESVRSSIVADLGAADATTVGLTILMKSDDGGGYGTNADPYFAVEYAVQFVTLAGFVSSISGPAQYAGFGENGTLTTIISAREDLPLWVKSINLYRRITLNAGLRTDDAEFELIDVAHVRSKPAAVQANPYEIEISDTYTHTGGVPDDASAVMYAIDVSGTIPSTGGTVMSTTREFRYKKRANLSNPSAYLTTGWVYTTDGASYGNSGLDIHHFVSRHMETSGAAEYSLIGPNTSEFTVHSNFAAVFGRDHTSSVASRVVDHDSKIGLKQILVNVPTLGNVTVGGSVNGAMTELAKDSAIAVRAQGPTFNYAKYDNGSVSGSASYNNYPSTSPLHAYGCVYVGYCDGGEPTPSTLRSVIGMDTDQISDCKPRSVKIVGGRLFGLNVDMDGSTYPTRLVYSEFRALNVFGKSNYVEYGYRTDSSGVAMAAFAGRIVVCTLTASYLFDVSGGSEMSWRELGAFEGFGLLHSRAIIETPAGVFYCGPSDAYWFNGQSIRPITRDLPNGANVSSTYASFVGSGITGVGWRSSKNQVLVFSGSKALVFSVQTGAWSEFDFSDEVADVSLDMIASMYHDGEDILASYSGGTFGLWAFAHAGDACPFHWLLETGPIGMGASEFVKKIKRLYMDARPNSVTAVGTITATTGAGISYEIAPPSSGAVIKTSISYRDYLPSFTVEGADIVEGGAWTSWNGVIESLGLVYRPKRLK